MDCWRHERAADIRRSALRARQKAARRLLFECAAAGKPSFKFMACTTS